MVAEFDRVLYRAASAGKELIPITECEVLREEDLLIVGRNDYWCDGIKLLSIRNFAGVAIITIERQEWCQGNHYIQNGTEALTDSMLLKLRTRWDVMVTRGRKPKRTLLLLGSPIHEPGWRKNLSETITAALEIAGGQISPYSRPTD